MARFANADGMNCATTEEPRTVSATNANEEATSQTPHQPNVRHIPIFVEGRDEPLINNIQSNINSTSRPTPVINDLPKTESIFSRVKDIPIRKVNMGNSSSANIPRAVSPGRTIPINVIHTKSQKDDEKNAQQHYQPPPAPVDPIEKIQKIQQEVLQLMDRVEKYPGGSRSDKEYLYLDEMLTQNLLKLDTIDTDGKENIKLARKEAIRCINKCISVLEAKTDSGNMQENKNEEPKSPKSEQQDNETNNSQPQQNSTETEKIPESHNDSNQNPTSPAEQQQTNSQNVS